MQELVLHLKEDGGWSLQAGDAISIPAKQSHEGKITIWLEYCNGDTKMFSVTGKPLEFLFTSPRNIFRRY